ncbi:MAG: PhoH family protein [Gammaproteobacteria bacterium]|nr:PhoH family protein [Gammaproteobacteria bacterium]
MCKKSRRNDLSVAQNDTYARATGANKKKFHTKDLTKVHPLTKTQGEVFASYNSNFNLFLHGSAGTGKTFLSMYLALREVLEEGSPYDKLIIIRSSVATRDVGFLKGDLEEKIAVFEAPYSDICDRLFTYSKTYENMKKIGYIEFMSSSYLRGLTFDNAIILVDECENMNAHELDSIITRVGKDAKIIFSGDIKQTDLLKSSRDKTGIEDFMRVVAHMPEFALVEFTTDDIVRSGLVKSYLITKEKLNL